jgi:predicted secreted protein
MNKIAVGTISALAGGVLVVSGASAASATTQHDRSFIQIRDIAPNPVVVKDDNETTAYFKIVGSRDLDSVNLTVAPDSPEARTMAAKVVKKLDTWRFSVPFNKNDSAGKWKATVEGVKDGKVVTHDDASFYVKVIKTPQKAHTRISDFEASPSRVRKGRTVTVSGDLEAWGRGWDDVRGAKVNVYFRQYGSSGWKYVASDYTDRHGDFSANTRAYKSGTFKAVYAGSDKLYGTTSHYDSVRVYSWHH